MAIISPSATLRDAIATAFKNAIDAGGSVGSAGTLKLYSGTRPVTPELSIASDLLSGAIKLLGTLTLSYPCGTVTSGELQFDAIAPDMLADASGIASWARLSTFAGVPVVDVDVSVVAGVGTLQMNSVNVVKDGPIICTSLAIAA